MEIKGIETGSIHLLPDKELLPRRPANASDTAGFRH